MVAFLMSIAVALMSHSGAVQTHGTAQAHSTNFPARGIVVPGKSIAGVTLGLTEKQVQARWGRNFDICKDCGTKALIWLYEYPGAEPLGAAVKFSVAGKVISVFTLGSPAGWGLKGAMMGDPISNVYTLFGNTGTINCIGYDALTVRIGGSTTSFYSASGVIYGYALTAPTEPPCQ